MKGFAFLLSALACVAVVCFIQGGLLENPQMTRDIVMMWNAAWPVGLCMYMYLMYGGYSSPP